jgi:peptidyl-prolyl cis-trans isomerase B (cyclophilin B)
MNTTKIKFTIKDFGTITAELYPEKAPATVENFLSLVNGGFFSGLIFHRVINGFMIQGGGFDESFEQKEAASIRGEFMANGFMQNDLKHTRGVLSMARTSDPNSGSSQFFVMHKDAPHLDAQYAGFGKLTDGFDVLDAIAGTKTGSYGWYMQDVPREPVVIEKVEVISK